MAVYVDDFKASYRGMKMCHMLADTDEELHQMADKIGVNRKWWQSPDKTSGSHYDICLSKRKIAIEMGAVEITVKQMAAMNHYRRHHGSLCLPSEAIRLYRERLKAQ